MKPELLDEKFQHILWLLPCASCGDFVLTVPDGGEVVFCKECTARVRPDSLSDLYDDLGEGD
jgi:hypothetical protein